MKNKKHTSAPLGASLVVLSSIIYASYGVWIVLMGNFFGSFIQAVLRAILVVLFLVPFALWRKELKRVQWRRDAYWILGLLISSALIPAPLYYAVLHIGVGIGIGIAYAGIILGAFFFGWLYGKEQYTKDKLLSTALGIVGLWLVFSPNMQALGIMGMLAALLSGCASGLNMVIAKNINYSPSQTGILTWTATIVANLPIVFLLQEPVPSFGLDIHWLYLLLYTFASLTASWTLISGLKLIEAGTAGILGLLEVVFGILYGVILFREHPHPIALVGMGCIILAAAIPYFQHYNKQKGTID